VSSLWAQGLNPGAQTRDDWEEINFEFNSSVLSDGYPSLLRLAELLMQHQDYRVRVTGNTDDVGAVAFNERLGLARANAVRDFLIKYGAADNQITTASQGKTAPAVSNTTPEGRFINRRVTLLVTDGQGGPYVLPHPCRRTETGWVSSSKGTPLAVTPVSWKPIGYHAPRR